MYRSCTTQIIGVMALVALVLGLADPALAKKKKGKNPEARLTQNWDKQLDATNGEANGCNSDRFTCLFGDTVVRDNETGLVWERDPAPSFLPWLDDITHCAQREVGGRKGWHLPMVEQLATLVDSTGTSGLALPDGHPFRNVQPTAYYSATTVAGDPTGAWVVDFPTGNVLIVFFKDTFLTPAWCVRGGQAFDGNTHQTLH